MSKSILKFLSFRLSQLSRFFKEIGVLRLGVVLPVFYIFLLYLVETLTQINPLAVIILYISPISLFHFSRQDFVFLTHLKHHKFTLQSIEYNIVALPISIAIIVVGNYWLVLVGHIVVTLLALIPTSNKTKNLKGYNDITQSIPSHLFEWRTMFRKYYWVAIPSYIIGVLLSYSIITLPVLLLLWTTLIAYTFSHFEPREFIEQYSFKSSFIKDKIKNHSVFLHVLFGPHYLLFMFFHYEYVFILIPVFIFIQSVLLFCIFFKYSHSNSYGKVVRNEIPTILFSLLTVFLFPLSIVILYNYWRKLTIL